MRLHSLSCRSVVAAPFCLSWAAASSLLHPLPVLTVLLLGCFPVLSPGSHPSGPLLHEGWAQPTSHWSLNKAGIVRSQQQPQERTVFGTMESREVGREEAPGLGIWTERRKCGCFQKENLKAQLSLKTSEHSCHYLDPTAAPRTENLNLLSLVNDNSPTPHLCTSSSFSWCRWHTASSWFLTLIF